MQKQSSKHYLAPDGKVLCIFQLLHVLSDIILSLSKLEQGTCFIVDQGTY